MSAIILEPLPNPQVISVRSLSNYQITEEQLDITATTAELEHVFGETLHLFTANHELFHRLQSSYMEIEGRIHDIKSRYERIVMHQKRVSERIISGLRDTIEVHYPS